MCKPFVLYNGPCFYRGLFCTNASGCQTVLFVLMETTKAIRKGQMEQCSRLPALLYTIYIQVQFKIHKNE